MSDPGIVNIPENWRDGDIISASDINTMSERINDTEDRDANDDAAIAALQTIVTALQSDTADDVEPADLAAAVATINAAITGKQPRFLTGTVATAAATAAKAVTLDATPAAGDLVLITWTLGQQISTPTLSVNGGAAKGIVNPQSSGNYASTRLAAGRSSLYIYDGTVYQSIGTPHNDVAAAITDALLINPADVAGGLFTGRIAAMLGMSGTPVGDIVTTPAGFTTVPRRDMRSGVSATGTGTMRMSHFRTALAGARSNISFGCNSGPSGGTPTLIRAAVYQYNADGTYTLLATTANDTAILAATNTMYTKALSAPVTFVAGQEYAWGLLVVQAAGTTPLVYASAPMDSTEASLPPRVNGAVFGITDIPTASAGTLAAASVLGSGLGNLYARFS